MYLLNTYAHNKNPAPAKRNPLHTDSSSRSKALSSLLATSCIGWPKSCHRIWSYMAVPHSSVPCPCLAYALKLQILVLYELTFGSLWITKSTSKLWRNWRRRKLIDGSKHGSYYLLPSLKKSDLIIVKIIKSHAFYRLFGTIKPCPMIWRVPPTRWMVALHKLNSIQRTRRDPGWNQLNPELNILSV